MTKKLELTWYGKEKEIRVEPRILIENRELSNIKYDENTENILIHGDNLLALKALEKKYSSKIKCIYIDPPYNTGSALEHYDDNLEHSIWLDLMRPRLVILKKLLKTDGAIAIQIGDDEMAYLKVLMDEIFGRNNCFGQVAVRMSHSAGMKRKSADKRLIKNTEYILFYFKEELPKITPIYEISMEYPVNYYHYVEQWPTGNNYGKYTSLIKHLKEKFPKEFDLYDLKLNNKSIGELFRKSEIVKKFIIDNKKSIIRTDTNVPNIDSENKPKDKEFFKYETEERDYYIGINSNGNYYQIYSLEEKIRQVDSIDENGNIKKIDAVTNLLGDWWDDFYRDMSRVDVEGGVKMKTSKKPERLIYRILTLLTEKNDIILDSFLGSGTTTAVAHKMERKWIGIEMGEHAYNLSKPRMDNVINGDTTGISKIANWQGGGGYRFYELAPTLINEDEFGEPIINKEYSAEMLASAIALHEGYTYQPSDELFWKQSKGNEKSFLFVTTRFIDQNYLAKIKETMQDDEFLIIACKSYDSSCENQFKNIKIKKIPNMLLSKCEFGKEDYNLNIINPPTYDEEEE